MRVNGEVYAKRKGKWVKVPTSVLKWRNRRDKGVPPNPRPKSRPKAT